MRSWSQVKEVDVVGQPAPELLAQMTVRVDEARDDDEAASRARLGLLSARFGPDVRDPAALQFDDSRVEHRPGAVHGDDEPAFDSLPHPITIPPCRPISSCATRACSTGGSSISRRRTAAGTGSASRSMSTPHALDAEARLVTAPLVDCHLHLDASLTAGKPRWNESGTLIEGIHVWGELKPSLTEQDVFERAREIVRWSVAQGTLFIRAHADVSGENEAMVRGLLRVRDELADLCTVQVTAFPQDGIFARDGDDERLENALRLGVDCVGGIPHYEPTSELGLKEVHRVFELAKQYSRRIDVHCDETDDPARAFSR